MSLGFPEIVVICVVALLVLGPDKLPDAMRKVGGLIHDVRNFQETVRNEVEQALRNASAPSYSDQSGVTDPEPTNPPSQPAPPPAEQFVDDHDAPPAEALSEEQDATEDQLAAPNADPQSGAEA